MPPGNKERAVRPRLTPKASARSAHSAGRSAVEEACPCQPARQARVSQLRGGALGERLSSLTGENGRRTMPISAEEDSPRPRPQVVHRHRCPASLVADSGAIAFPDRLLPARELMRKRYESFRTLPRHRGPPLIVQAAREVRVRAQSTHRPVQAPPREPDLLSLAGAVRKAFHYHPRYQPVIDHFR